jgi:hypothetical protein
MAAAQQARKMTAGQKRKMEIAFTTATLQKTAEEKNADLDEKIVQAFAENPGFKEYFGKMIDNGTIVQNFRNDEYKAALARGDGDLPEDCIYMKDFPIEVKQDMLVADSGGFLVKANFNKKPQAVTEQVFKRKYAVKDDTILPHPRVSDCIQKIRQGAPANHANLQLRPEMLEKNSFLAADAKHSYFMKASEFYTDQEFQGLQVQHPGFGDNTVVATLAVDPINAPRIYTLGSDFDQGFHIKNGWDAYKCTAVATDGTSCVLRTKFVAEFGGPEITSLAPAAKISYNIGNNGVPNMMQSRYAKYTAKMAAKRQKNGLSNLIAALPRPH